MSFKSAKARYILYQTEDHGENVFPREIEGSNPKRDVGTIIGKLGLCYTILINAPVDWPVTLANKAIGQPYTISTRSSGIRTLDLARENVFIMDFRFIKDKVLFLSLTL